eukprot:TRINITY_DN31845_c0_g1_i1.p1 TRINITY_DN31845_c0_g1~~TRINITY_DN31845_c0_g1_i1.p1  ORF type:complete len:239 (+),score=42.97 TRINITY_DN31845_c0_g1_i1:49-717(+)
MPSSEGTPAQVDVAELLRCFDESLQRRAGGGVNSSAYARPVPTCAKGLKRRTMKQLPPLRGSVAAALKPKLEGETEAELHQSSQEIGLGLVADDAQATVAIVDATTGDERGHDAKEAPRRMVAKCAPGSAAAKAAALAAVAAYLPPPGTRRVDLDEGFPDDDLIPAAAPLHALRPRILASYKPGSAADWAAQRSLAASHGHTWDAQQHSDEMAADEPVDTEH